MALGGLGAEVAGGGGEEEGQARVGRQVREADAPLDLAGGANARVEHEVKLDGLGHLVARLGRDNLEVADELAQLGARVVVDLGERRLVLLDHLVVELDGDRLDLLLLLLLGRVLDLLDLGDAARLLVALEAGLEDALDEVVGAVDLVRLRVLDHPVGELVDVARRLENVRQGHDGRVELEHLLLDDEVLAPRVEDVGLERRARRALCARQRPGQLVWKERGAGGDEKEGGAHIVVQALDACVS